MKRQLWVIEQQGHSGKWYPVMYLPAGRNHKRMITNQKGRKFISDTKTRLVKYIPSK